MSHPILGRADLVEVLGTRDPDLLDAVAGQLGLVRRAEKRPSPQQPDDVKTVRPPRSKQDSSGYPKNIEDIALWMVTHYELAKPWTRSEREDSRSDYGWTLQPENAPPRRLLAPWNVIGPRLRAGLGDLRTQHPNIEKLIDHYARRELITQIPKEEKRRWGDLSVVCDTSLRMIPFEYDQHFVVGQLRDQVPPECIRVFEGASPASLRERPDPPGAEPQPFELPPPDSLVLVLGDLGWLATSTAWWYAWRKWGQRLQSHGCRLQALVPFSVKQLPPVLKELFSVQSWQPDRQAYVTDRGRRTRLVNEILTLAAPTLRLEPGLMRELRMLVPEAGDASLEVDVWNSPLLSSNHPVAATIDRQVVREQLRDQFIALPRETRRAALQCIRNWRKNIAYAPEIWLEEALSLDADSRLLIPQQDITDARATIREFNQRRLKSGGSSLNAWWDRVTLRLSDAAFEDEEVGLLLRDVRRELHPTLQGVAPGTDPREIPAGTLCEYRLAVYDDEVVVAPSEKYEHDRAIGPPEFTVRSSNQHFTLQAGAATTESSFWKSGQKPNYVSDFGTDHVGAWFEFQIPHAESESGHVTHLMRWIPAGDFMMGSPEDEQGRDDDESPQHRVTLTRGFWLAETPCTQALWQAVTGENPSHFPGDSLPVESVSWEDTQTFLEQLNGNLPGLAMSLPSEAQWEYACRAGTTSRYWSGEELDESQANFASNVGKTTPAKSYTANPKGLYDMHGNVLEWCQDWKGDYQSDEQIDPTGPEEGSYRVMRGGSWFHNARYARSAYRDWSAPGNRGHNLGFRCMSSVAEPTELAEVPVAEQGSQPTRVGGAGGNFGARTVKVSAHDLTKIQTGGSGSKLAISTDLEELHFSRLTRPKWATAFGRDAYGVFADFELAAVDDRDSKARQRLRWIPPGRFAMGSPDDESGRNNNEVLHDVTITSGFWMFETPCTQQLWLAVMGGENPSRFPDPERPVEQLSWDDANEFTERISEQLRQQYNDQSDPLNFRLPTEAEWEYACRAGSNTAIYSGSLEIIGAANAPDLDPIAWYGGNSGHEFDHDQPENVSDFWLANEEKQYEFSEFGTRKAKLKAPNPWGLYDMLGNVWEWCQDWHADYDVASAVDPAGPDEGSLRVMRGGSWFNHALNARSAYRNWNAPGDRYNNLGFRCMSSVSQ